MPGVQERAPNPARSRPRRAPDKRRNPRPVSPSGPSAKTPPDAGHAVLRNQHAEALARRERELDDFFEGASVGLLLVSPDGVIQRSNQAFRDLLGVRGRAMAGRTLRAFHPDAALLDSLLKRIAKRETFHNFPVELIAVDGGTRFVLLDADGLWVGGRLVHSRWLVRDISRRRQLERELLESSDRERRLFAQELHDGLGQQLGGVAYLSNVLFERLAERDAPEAGSAARIFELVRKAIEDTRRLARGLSPIPEVPDGLVQGLRDLTAQVSDVHGMRCRLTCREIVLVSDFNLSGHLYRIAQEALNNAVKHARPKSIGISLQQGGGRLRLAIVDDGRGMGPLSPTREGLGLRIMRYRAGLMRGSLEVAPNRPHGTRVTCVVPWPSAPMKSR